MELFYVVVLMFRIIKKKLFKKYIYKNEQKEYFI